MREDRPNVPGNGLAATASTGVRPRLALALLTLAIIISYIDRYTLAILIQPIKHDLKISDTGIGWLVGFAFSAIYAAFGFIVARWADRGHRRAVIVASLLIWSAMTALCGLAQNFWQLLVARIGVGAGEAGTMPASLSLISDLFPFERRGTALAVLGAGGGMGIMIAFAIGGALEHRVGWRWTMVWVSLPGLLLSGFILLWLKEPPLGRCATSGASGLDGEIGKGGLRDLLSNRVFRHLPFAQAGLALLLFGQTQWLPAFIERSFQVSRVEIGAALSLTQGMASLLGAILGGLITDRLARHNPLWPLRFAMGAIGAGMLPMVALYLATSVTVVYPFTALMTFLFAMPTGPLFSLLQTVVIPSQRATAAAIAALAAAFIGLGFGPLLIGILSDQLAASRGANSLRDAMLITVAMFGPWTLFQLARLDKALARLRDGGGDKEMLAHRVGN
jgi:MFS family permease